MPIKQFPPPTFLPDANWQKKGTGVNEYWTTDAMIDQDAWWGSVEYTYLVLTYRLGTYQLSLHVDDCDDDETSGLYLPLKREQLWIGKNPTVEALENVIKRYTDTPLKFLFHSEDYNDFNDYGYSQYGD